MPFPPVELVDEVALGCCTGFEVSDSPFTEEASLVGDVTEVVSETGAGGAGCAFEIAVLVVEATFVAALG